VVDPLDGTVNYFYGIPHYAVSIAALLLQLFTGRRPTRRMLELILWYLLGWASVEELTVGLERELARMLRVKIG